jgi:hypothetical protein
MPLVGAVIGEWIDPPGPVAGGQGRCGGVGWAGGVAGAVKLAVTVHDGGVFAAAL